MFKETGGGKKGGGTETGTTPDRRPKQTKKERWCVASSGAAPWICTAGEWGIELYQLEQWRREAGRSLSLGMDHGTQ